MCPHIASGGSDRDVAGDSRIISHLMMSAVLHLGCVRCKLVHVFDSKVQGEHNDGRSEAREGILPQVVEERVSSPRVLSSEYHF